MSYTTKVVQGVRFVFLMNILAAIAIYFVRVMLARRLGPTEYGLFYAVFTLITFLLFFRDLGLGSAVVYYIAKFNVQGKLDYLKTSIISVFMIQVLSSAVLVLVLAILSPWLAVSYFGDPRAETLLYILLIYVFTSVLFRNLKSMFQAFQWMKTFSLFEFLKNLLVASLVYIFLKEGVFTPAWAYAVVPSILAFIFFFPALKLFPFKNKVVEFGKVSKKMLLFGLPVTFTGIGGRIIGYLDTLILTHFVTLSEVGVYNVVLPSALLLFFLAKSVTAVIFPIVSEMWAKKELGKITAGVQVMFRYVFVLTAPFILGVLLYADFFISLFFGAEYVSGKIAMQIILLGSLFYVIGSVNNSIISAMGRPKDVTKIILLAAFVNVVLNFSWIPLWGIEGAALATMVSYILIYFLSVRTLKKRLSINQPPLSLWIKLLFTISVFIVTVLLVGSLDSSLVGVAVSLIFGGLVYLVVAYVLGLVSYKQLRKYLR